MWPFKKKQRITPDYIYKLKKNQVFVFGSNLAGDHAGGAAAQAIVFGAQIGNPVGRQGKTYAIPTLDEYRGKLNLNRIQIYVDEFVQYARIMKEDTFLVTEIGCGIAGFHVEEIAPLFYFAKDIDNIWLPESFLDILAPERNIS